MKKANSITLSIKGVDWKFYAQTDASYRRSHGKDSDAVTYPHDRDCYFNKSRLLPGTVRHELMHVFVASSGTNSANLTVEQMEELAAEIFEQHGPEMNVLVDKLLDFFLR